MPVRSLSSSVLKWPDQETVDQAARRWIRSQLPLHPELLCAAYFGSYARGDWGVGSDLDLLLIIADSDIPFIQRGAAWNTLDLPVSVDLLVYTQAEWLAICERCDRFPRQFEREAVWIYERQREANQG